MGKAGKARKRQRIDRDQLSCIDHNIELMLDADEDDVTTNVHFANSIKIATALCCDLGKRPDVYFSRQLKAFRRAIFPLIKIQENKHFEEMPQHDKKISLNESTLAASIQVFQFFSANLDEFQSLANKPFRQALHPLVQMTRSPNLVGRPCSAVASSLVDSMDSVLVDGNINSRISSCFRLQNWEGALVALKELSLSGTDFPKLGALQRWVRDCDISSRAAMETPKSAFGESSYTTRCEHSASQTVNTSLLLLHGVLSTMHSANYFQSQKSSGHGSSSSSSSFSKIKTTSKSSTASSPSQPMLCRRAEVIHAPVFSISGSESNLDQTQRQGLLVANFKDRVKVVSHVPGPQRRPPSQHDLNIYSTDPDTIVFSQPIGDHQTVSNGADAMDRIRHVCPSPMRYDVPSVPGAILMTDILTPSECHQFIVAAEAIGYAPDAVDGIDNVVWLADDSLVDTIFDRCKKLLPQHLNFCALAGINRRWRLFRYLPGAEYRPHIDGSWTCNGLDADTGDLVEDIFGDRRSRLTFLVYLNDDFEGGHTTFFLPEQGTSSTFSETIDAGSTNRLGTSSTRTGEKEKVDTRGAVAAGDASSHGSPVAGARADAVDTEDSTGTGINYWEGTARIFAYGVQPRLGSVLVFPHGDAVNSLVHEGSAVLSGAKYIIRSDVLYMNP